MYVSIFEISGEMDKFQEKIKISLTEKKVKASQYLFFIKNFYWDFNIFPKGKNQGHSALPTFMEK